jgi:two-component system, OmpR family, phosphate regulon sensor histidine kinase PhoR
VRGYPERLTSVLGNLTDNALKFTPAGGTITIGLAVDDGMARVWVSDTGIGVPAGDMEGLFGRFHRGRNASAYPGNGLGLAIVKATMDLHGGSVHAESSPGGSQFDVVLPLAVAAP